MGARLRLRRGVRRVRHALERFPAKGRTSRHGDRHLHRRACHDRRRVELPLHDQPPAGARRHVRIRGGGFWPRPRLPLRRFPRVCLLGDRLAGRDGASGRSALHAGRHLPFRVPLHDSRKQHLSWRHPAFHRRHRRSLRHLLPPSPVGRRPVGYGGHPGRRDTPLLRGGGGQPPRGAGVDAPVFRPRSRFRPSPDPEHPRNRAVALRRLRGHFEFLLGIPFPRQEVLPGHARSARHGGDRLHVPDVHPRAHAGRRGLRLGRRRGRLGQFRERAGLPRV